MKLIEREYLKDLIDIIGTPDIKVITGVRRSGKSKLLEELKKYINRTDTNNNIIHINYNLPKFEKLKTYDTLVKYVEESYNDNMNNYLLIDEVQI